MRTEQLVSVLVLVAGTRQVKAEERAPRFIPTIALEAGLYSERMTLHLRDTQEQDTRDLNNTRLAIGLGYTIDENWLGLGELRTQSNAGFGLVYSVGEWPLQVRQEVNLRYSPIHWLALVIGAETSLQLNTSRLSHSYAELGLVAGINIAGHVDLLYLPALFVALGSESDDVFGGSTKQQIDSGFHPINFALRVHLGALGW